MRDGKNIYIGLQQGGMVRKSSKWELFTKEENSNMPGNDIRKMVVGKIQQIEMNGKKLNTSPIWVATATGLGRFIPQKDTESKGDWESASFRSVAVKMQGGLQTDDLTDLVYDKASETLWIATNGGGLTRLRVGLL